MFSKHKLSVKLAKIHLFFIKFNHMCSVKEDICICKRKDKICWKHCIFRLVHHLVWCCLFRAFFRDFLQCFQQILSFLLQIQMSSLTEHMWLFASVLFKRGSNSKNEMQQKSHFQWNLICIFFFKIIIVIIMLFISCIFSWFFSLLQDQHYIIVYPACCCYHGNSSLTLIWCLQVLLWRLKQSVPKPH
jgi:hypothetical protein